MKKNIIKSKTKNIESKRRLSITRLLMVFLIMLGSIYFTASKLEEQKQQKKAEEKPTYKPWFASYVDVTSTPLYNFEKLGATKTSDVILSFIVSSSSNSCIPTWGNYYTMDKVATTIDLDRRITRLQQQGGRVAISFGGALNSEIALKCKNADKLYDAYNSVIKRYHINTIDIDLENQGLSDIKAGKRRANVLAKLQKDYRKQNKGLAIWLTLPVAPQGLTKEATDMIAEVLSSGVDLAGINLMTMDYGQSLESGKTMSEGSEQALIETHRQLKILYEQSGINLSDKSVWKKIGATPMIGQNDIRDEIFTLEDAKKFNLFSQERGIGRMSMWSANRDIPCGENYVDKKVVSDSCSGVNDPKFSFLQTLSNGFDGDLMQNVDSVTVSDAKSGVIIDDPEKSPYQIWKETGAYPRGVKIVWHGNVYEAKWWTRNDLPDNPVLQSWETPWRLIGPVMPGEKPIKQPTLPKGTYPKWSGEIIYNGGDRVLFEGTPFQAKWWNKGESPAASIANPDSSPWLSLTQSQIVDILKKLNKK